MKADDIRKREALLAFERAKAATNSGMKVIAPEITYDDAMIYSPDRHPRVKSSDDPIPPRVFTPKKEWF